MVTDMQFKTVNPGPKPRTTIVTGKDSATIKSYLMGKQPVAAWWPEIRFGGTGGFPEPRVGEELRDKCETLVGRTFATLSPLVINTFLAAVKYGYMDADELEIIYTQDEGMVKPTVTALGRVDLWPECHRFCGPPSDESLVRI